MDYKKEFTPLQVTIIDAWKKTKVVHPSYGGIALELGCSPDTVFRTVKKFLILTNNNGQSKDPKGTSKKA